MEDIHKLTEDLQKNSQQKMITLDDASMFDYTEEYYKSSEYFQKEFPFFPKEFYNILELHANGITPKQYKLMVKKEKKKNLKKNSKKTKNV